MNFIRVSLNNFARISIIQMLDDYGTDPYITKMVDEFDWYILPVTNPDGYVFTWEHVRNDLLI